MNYHKELEALQLSKTVGVL